MSFFVFLKEKDTVYGRRMVVTLYPTNDGKGETVCFLSPSYVKSEIKRNSLLGLLCDETQQLQMRCESLKVAVTATGTKRIPTYVYRQIPHSESAAAVQSTAN